ncbi:MAG: hypothetical protein R3288_15520, partial [Woeseiaceae bacterium]|nr:hypothetical protein [Woeseiaceae bacterium]
MRVVLKWLRRTFAFVVIAAVFVLGVVAIALNTEFGSRFVINRIVAAVPVSLEVSGVRGTLWRGLHVGRFSYRDDGRDIAGTAVDLVIDWPATTLGGIALDDLRVETFTYRSLADVAAEPEPLRIDMTPLPFSIAVDELAADTVTLVFGDAETVLSGLRASAVDFAGRDLAIGDAAVQTTLVALELSDVGMGFGGDVPARAVVRWSQPDGEWSGSGEFDGS